MVIPETLSLTMQAALWGGVAGGALLAGAGIGYFARLPERVSGAIMTFGVGVLISALAFDLMDEAFTRGGLGSAAAGFAIGAALYALASGVLAGAGARARKRAIRPVTSASGASLAIALGSLLDGVPESTAIGISLLDGEGVALVTVFAIAISNVPEGLSSAVGMRRAGKSAGYVFGIWGAIALACSISAAVGAAFMGALGPAITAGAIACAAGAILVMLVDTMVPEAFEEMHSLTGLIAAAGFLVAFAASHVL